MSTHSRDSLRAILVAAVWALAPLAAGGTEMFTGAWTAGLTLAVQTNPVTAFESRLDCAVDLGPLGLSTRSDFDAGGWLWQSFGITSSVAFLSLQADVLYTPDPWAFCYSSGYAKLDFGQIWATYYVGFLGSIFDPDILRGSVFELGLSLGGTRARGLLFLGATLDGILFEPSPSYILCSSGTCCIAPSTAERAYTVVPVQTSSLAFTGARVEVESYVCHDVTLCATTEFSPAGFEFQEFRTEIWSIGPVPINLDVLLRFETQSKSLAIEPKFGVGSEVCYGRVLVELITPGPVGLIEGISVYGLDLSLNAPAFAFRSLSVFDTDRFCLFQDPGSLSLRDGIWVDVIGAPGVCGSAGEALSDYWEIVGVAAYRGDPCARTLSFLALSYFGESDALFDWMRSEFRAEIAVMQGLALRSVVVLDSDGISDWSLGIRVSW